MKKFSERVSSLRGRLGLSQEAFAKRLGVSRNYVSMIEQGREPSASLKRLIETLETPPSTTPAPMAVPTAALREDTVAYRFTPRQEVALATSAQNSMETLAACHTLLDSFVHITSADHFEFALKALMEKLETYKKIKLS